jgi:chemotaxis protein MotA
LRNYCRERTSFQAALEEGTVDLATLIGLVGACVVVATAILLGGSVSAFVDSAALVLVVGGTLLVTLMKFSFGQFANATKVAIKAFIYRVPDPETLIDTSMYLATRRARAACWRSRRPTFPTSFSRRRSISSSTGTIRRSCAPS